MRRENVIAGTARRERNRYPLLESHTIRNLRLCPFGSLAKNPLANIGWAVNQYDAPVLALTQESNSLNVHKSDLVQGHEYANAVMVYLSPYVADIRRLYSTTEPRGCSVAFDSFSILNLKMCSSTTTTAYGLPASESRRGCHASVSACPAGDGTAKSRRWCFLMLNTSRPTSSASCAAAIISATRRSALMRTPVLPPQRNDPFRFVCL